MIFARGAIPIERLVVVLVEFRRIREIVGKRERGRDPDCSNATLQGGSHGFKLNGTIFARRLGEWTLLLRLAAGMLRKRLSRGDSVEGAVAYVGEALDKHGVMGTRTDKTRSPAN